MWRTTPTTSASVESNEPSWMKDTFSRFPSALSPGHVFFASVSSTTMTLGCAASSASVKVRPCVTATPRLSKKPGSTARWSAIAVFFSDSGAPSRQ